ncbi:MAG: aminoacyl-tRNA hydrolase [Deltaproteobacteria bacterium]|nr:aminoacyl-tRNA hydrolase [Deltaproteobacteria bacterium]
MWLIVGLGNPGTKHKNTRHNIGFMAVDYLAEANGIRFNKSDFKSHLGKGNILGREVILVKPQTFMNLSGEAVKLLANYFRLEPRNIVVIYDDVDLEFGAIRIRQRGGSGGHKGIESIIEQLETNSFPRIRLGIGRPEDRGQGSGVRGQMDVAEYVLSPFNSEEADTVLTMLNRTKEAVDVILKDGVEKAMNRFNTR